MSTLLSRMLAATFSRTLPSPPRQVHRSASSGCSLTFLRLFILPHMLIGIGALAYIPVRALVQYFGTPVTATVQRKDSRNGSKGKVIRSVQYHDSFADRTYS